MNNKTRALEELNGSMIFVANGWIRKVAPLPRSPLDGELWRCIAKPLNRLQMEYPQEIDASKVVYDLFIFKRSLYLEEYKAKHQEFEIETNALG